MWPFFCAGHRRTLIPNGPMRYPQTTTFLPDAMAGHKEAYRIGIDGCPTALAGRG